MDVGRRASGFAIATNDARDIFGLGEEAKAVPSDFSVAPS